MENQSTKTLENAQVATEQKPVQEPSKIIEDLKKQIPKSFHKFLEPILKYVEDEQIWKQSVESRFIEIEKTLPEKLQKSYAAALEDARSKQLAMAQQQPQQTETPRQGISAAEVLSIGEKLLTGGSSNPNSEIQTKVNTLTATLLDKALERLTKPSRFEDILEEELMKAKAKAIAAAVSSS